MSSGALWGTSFGGLDGSRLSVYDELMVPRIFTPWARLLVDTLEIAPEEAVLDVACGPGSVARVAAEAAGARGRVVGCDLSPTMIALAREKPQAPGAAPVEYHEAPADHLPAPNEAFDAITCQQGLQFFPDRPAALAEMRRVLKERGRIGVVVWTAIEHSPPFRALADAVQHVAGAELANRYRAGPYGLPDSEELRGLLSAAGFHEIVVTPHTLPVSFENGAAEIVATLAVTPLADDIDALGAEGREELVSAVAREVGEGPVSATLEANLAVARR